MAFSVKINLPKQKYEPWIFFFKWQGVTIKSWYQPSGTAKYPSMGKNNGNWIHPNFGHASSIFIAQLGSWHFLPPALPRWMVWRCLPSVKHGISTTCQAIHWLFRVQVFQRFMITWVRKHIHNILCPWYPHVSPTIHKIGSHVILWILKPYCDCYITICGFWTVYNNPKKNSNKQPLI